jgi:predicted nucleic acid-binding Zn ribbon protein
MSDETVECPSCALPIDADADVCPYCQYERPKQKRGFGIIALLFILLMLTWLLW